MVDAENSTTRNIDKCEAHIGVTGSILCGFGDDAFNARSKVVGIYLHCKPDGQVFYVGKGTPRRARCLSQRPKRHRDTVKKYGLDKIRIVFFPCASEREALEKEISLIALYRAAGEKLLNLTDGGEGVSGFKIPIEVVERRSLALRGKPKSESHKKKIREALLGRKLSEAHRQKIVAASRRPEVKAKQRAARIGSRHSPETKEKSRLASLGRKLSTEARSKISAFHKGRKHTQEQVRKIASALRGRRNSPEVLAKKRAAKAQRVLITCKFCGKECFRFPLISLYCGKTCKSRAYRKRKKVMGSSILPTLPGVAYPVTRTPVFSTLLQTAISGKESRLATQSYPRWKWELTYNILRSAAAYAEYQNLMGFFLARQGMCDSFLYQDADDNAVTGQQIGIGNGTTTNFQLIRSFGSFIEPVLAPNLTVTPQLYVNGVLKVYGTDYSVNAWGNAGGPGLINFLTGAPASGAVITANFSYYWPCRMSADDLATSLMMQSFYEIKKFSFISCKN